MLSSIYRTNINILFSAFIALLSLGVGYELAYSQSIGKKHIMTLYRKQGNKSLSAMIAGDPNLTNRTYESLEDAKVHIDEFMASIQE